MLGKELFRDMWYVFMFRCNRNEGLGMEVDGYFLGLNLVFRLFWFGISI